MPYIDHGTLIDVPGVPYVPIPLMPTNRKPMKPPKAPRISEFIKAKRKKPSRRKRS